MGDALSAKSGPDNHVEIKRLGCCAGWPKPCSYHEGYQDAYEALRGGNPRVERILWNYRDEPGKRGEIDEVVLCNVDVHIEQMNDGCWWMGFYRHADPDIYWMGNIHTKNPRSRTHITFTEQENAGIEWQRDESHVR